MQALTHTDTFGNGVSNLFSPVSTLAWSNSSSILFSMVALWTQEYCIQSFLCLAAAAVVEEVVVVVVVAVVAVEASAAAEVMYL